MQYTLSMTSRMLAIAALCVFLLCALLFLLGIEIGKRMSEPEASQMPPAAGSSGAVIVAPSASAMPALPAAPVAPAAPAIPTIAVTAKP